MIRFLLALAFLVPSFDAHPPAVVPAQDKQEGEETIVLKGARILPIGGPEISNGSIVICEGKIQAIGERVEAPSRARVIDLTGKVVMPGLIDASSFAGISGPSNEEGDEVSAHVRILDSIDPANRDLERARKSGVTTVFVGPGFRSVIGGLGAVIKTSGKTRADLVLREDAALKAAMGPGPSSGNFPPRGSAASFFARRPTTRMGVAWEFRKAFHDARRYREEKGAGDAGKDVLVQALEGRLPVRVTAGRATDIETALHIAQELGLSIILEEAQEGWKLADVLARRKIPVLLRPAPILAASGGTEMPELRLDTFLLLDKAGVVTALLPSSEKPGEGLLATAAFAVKHGSGRAEALRAITRTPAEILGVADRVGALEPGKEADLLVFSGDPLDVTSRLERVMIRGRWVAGERTKP